MPKTFLATVVAVLALVAVGCGGSDEASSVTPTTWADGFCSAITTWGDALTSVTHQLSTPSLSTPALEDVANDATSATETLVDDLKGLGVPDTESGQAVKDSIDGFTATLEREAASIHDAADGAVGVSGLRNAIGSITTSLAAMGAAALTSTADLLQNTDAKDELRTAFKDAPACAEVSG